MTKKKKTFYPPPILPRRVIEELLEAQQLMKDGQPEEARQILADLDRQRPHQPDILGLLANACHDLNDLQGYEWAVYRMSQAAPADAEAALGLAGAYLANLRPGLAIRVLEGFLKRWPEHPHHARTLKEVTELRTQHLRDIDEPNLSEEEALELSAWHDEVRFFMEHGQFEQSRRSGEKLLERHPGFLPVMNNLAQVDMLQGNLDAAERRSWQALELDPGNVHALSNLVHLRFLAGDVEQARILAQRLVESRSPAFDRWAKIAEALSYIGDDQGVLEAYAQAGKAGDLDTSPAGALLLHFAAAAYAFTGQAQQASRLWLKALKQDPSLGLARENLADMDRPAGERSGPWAFGITTWIPNHMLQEMTGAAPGKRVSQSERRIEATARQGLARHPEWPGFFAHLLQRGDDATVQFVAGWVQLVQTPELLEALKDFALGQHGSDKQRMKAAQFLSSKGLLPSGAVRLWSGGRWAELLLLNFEIYSDAQEDGTPPRAQRLAEQAAQALYAGEAKRAQELLEKALAIHTGSPSLYNNLALAFQMQGEMEKSLALTREINQRFPDYFFGIAAEARLAIQKKDLERARKLLNGLMQRQRLHVSEFDTLCAAQIELSLAEKNTEGAKSWFKLWERPDPDNPKLEEYRLLLFGPQGMEKLVKLLGRR